MLYEPESTYGLVDVTYRTPLLLAAPTLYVVSVVALSPAASVI
jgi:hypothetical protein